MVRFDLVDRSIGFILKFRSSIKIIESLACFKISNCDFD